MPNKIFFEITNICNLNCSFCHGTKRKKRFVTKEEFALALPKLKGFGEYLYFHLMGEPTLHPELDALFDIASQKGFKVILTTNGTLLAKQRDMLLAQPALHKINISLHAFEANDLAVPFQKYLEDCLTFGQAARGKKIVVFRLWNQGGAEEMNGQIEEALHAFFPDPWQDVRQGKRLTEKIFLEYGDKFDWPDLKAPEGGKGVFCYGLRDQLGVLCDGTVVPCCLDHEGDLALGNLLHQDMEEILESPRATAIYQGFSKRIAAEELCRRCGYARRFG